MLNDVYVSKKRREQVIEIIKELIREKGRFSKERKNYWSSY